MSNNYEDKFGYLPEAIEIIFSIGKITPLPDIKDIYTKVSERAYKQSYLFSPQIITKRPVNRDIFNSENDEIQWEDEPGSIRPAPMMHLPPTHKIEICGPVSTSGRMGIGSYLINLAAFFYGTRAQFHDWRVDGRATIKNRSCFSASKKSREMFFNLAICTWEKYPDEYRVRITNIIFLYLRALSEEYDWLEFTLMYMVFDSCYWLASKYYGVKAKRHIERPQAVAKKFGIIEDTEKFTRWVEFRNNLFHEALWLGDTPGSSTKSKRYNDLLYFQAFVCRVITALLGYTDSFISSKWNSVGRVSL